MTAFGNNILAKQSAACRLFYIVLTNFLIVFFTYCSSPLSIMLLNLAFCHSDILAISISTITTN